MDLMTIAQVKETIRRPYSWPGGYRRLFLMSDGEIILPSTARDNFREVVTDMKANDGSWNIVDIYLHWDGAPLVDAHTGEQIDSEYGE